MPNAYPAQFIDAPIEHTALPVLVKGGFVSVVILLCLAVGFLWWQWLILLAVFFGVVWLDYYRYTPVYHLTAKSFDEIWYLGMNADGERREIWQAYLHGATYFGFAIKLDFFVVVPFEYKFVVWVYKNSVTTDAFARLSAMARHENFRPY